MFVFHVVDTGIINAVYCLGHLPTSCSCRVAQGLMPMLILLVQVKTHKHCILLQSLPKSIVARCMFLSKATFSILLAKEVLFCKC